MRMRSVARYVVMRCDCQDGDHIIDLDDPAWKNPRVRYYSCEDCHRPLVCRGDDGRMFYVGQEIRL